MNLLVLLDCGEEHLPLAQQALNCHPYIRAGQVRRVTAYTTHGGHRKLQSEGLPDDWASVTTVPEGKRPRLEGLQCLSRALAREPERKPPDCVLYLADRPSELDLDLRSRMRDVPRGICVLLAATTSPRLWREVMPTFQAVLADCSDACQLGWSSVSRERGPTAPGFALFAGRLDEVGFEWLRPRLADLAAEYPHARLRLLGFGGNGVLDVHAIQAVFRHLHDRLQRQNPPPCVMRGLRPQPASLSQYMPRAFPVASSCEAGVQIRGCLTPHPSSRTSS